MIRRAAILLALLACALAAPAAAQADFGLVPGQTSISALTRAGTPDTQAGSHPYSLNVRFALNTDAEGFTEGGALRDVVFKAPPGLVGNPQAIPSCPRATFENALPQCPAATQIGIVQATVPTGHVGLITLPLYNLTPPPGVAAQFGASTIGLTVLAGASLRPDDYGIDVTDSNLPNEVSTVSATLWGTPADPGHTPERGEFGGLPSEAPLLPFLTMPTSCGSPPQLSVEVDSKLNPGVFVGGEESVPMRDQGGNPITLTGCDRVPFSPTVAAAPSTTAADSAAGLNFGLGLKNEGLLNPKDSAIVETEPVKTEVDFPAGIAVNPSAANGIAACSLAQYESITAAIFPEGGCPQASKVGTLTAQTPLLTEPIEGSVYLAAPRDNPFDSFLAIYIVAKAAGRGVLVKQAGEVRADPTTGQLTTVVDGLPPVPYSSFEVKLREGPRAPLITPGLCGTYTTAARLYPFSDPGTATVRTAPFTIATGAGGASCAASESGLPAHPTLEAGTAAPLAGAYSPFVFRLSRADGEQRFAGLTATLPKGLTGKLAGVPYCSEAQIAAAKAREVEGGGALEAASPSCPAASQIGTVNVAAGAGQDPYYVQGKAYLAGPYKGAPLSLAIITPGIAGPFDLGAIVVRAGLYVDESTAQITIKSDPIPTILQGIPLDVRKIAVTTDRESFTLNPTNCEVAAVSAKVTMSTGALAPVQNRFQVAGCAGLGFKPNLSLELKGGTKRNQHPALKSVITYPKGSYANIARAQVTLPASEFIDQAHIGNPCIRPDFAAEKCPKLSILGKAKAWTPLLEKPEEGNVYFRSNGGERELPDLVVALKGQIPLTLVGFVDSQHHKGSEVSRLRTTFATVPDAPVSKFVIELKGGKEGLLVNSGNLCKIPNKAIVKLSAQNGKAYNTEPAVANGCGKKKKGKKDKKVAKRLGTSHR